MTPLCHNSSEVCSKPLAPLGPMAPQVEHAAQQAPLEVGPGQSMTGQWLQGQGGQSAASSAGMDVAPVSAPSAAPRAAGAFVPLDGDLAPFAAGVYSDALGPARTYRWHHPDGTVITLIGWRYGGAVPSG